MGNVVSQPGAGLAFGGAIYGLNSDLTIVSNIISDNSSEAGGGGIDLVNSSFTRVEYNDTWQNLPVNINGAHSAGPGNISADPRLLATGTATWCPRSHSPVIDAGPPGGTLDLTDIFGRTRHLDGNQDGIVRIDMGYCEGGDITEVRFGSAAALSWDPSVNPAAVYNLYRGVLSVLISSCATGCVYTQDPALVPGAQRQCGLAAAGASDTGAPPVGEAYFYLVSGKAAVEGILGFRQDGSIRGNTNPCP